MKYNSTMSSLAKGNVMAAAARNYQKVRPGSTCCSPAALSISVQSQRHGLWHPWATSQCPQSRYSHRAIECAAREWPRALKSTVHAGDGPAPRVRRAVHRHDRVNTTYRT
jgi:hypothetical protein